MPPIKCAEFILFLSWDPQRGLPQLQSFQTQSKKKKKKRKSRRERHSPGDRCHSGEIPGVGQYDGEMLCEREAPRL